MTDHRKFEATPAQRGTVAFYSGLGYEGNPYPVGSPEAAEWAERYRAAEKMHAEQTVVRPAEDCL